MLPQPSGVLSDGLSLRIACLDLLPVLGTLLLLALVTPRALCVISVVIVTVVFHSPGLCLQCCCTCPLLHSRKSALFLLPSSSV